MYTLITVLACLNIAGAAADTFLTVSVKKKPHKAKFHKWCTSAMKTKQKKGVHTLSWVWL